MAMKKAQMFPRLVDAEAEARFCAAVNARIEENLDDPLPDVDDEEVQASIDSIIWRAEARYSGDHLTKDPLNKSPRPSHPRNGRMTALPFAVNSAAIDSKCRLVLHPVP